MRTGLRSVQGAERKKRREMIRRDDSWHSLVSLTQVVGASKLATTPKMQVTQRSIYAQEKQQQNQQAPPPSQMIQHRLLASDPFSNNNGDSPAHSNAQNYHQQLNPRQQFGANNKQLSNLLDSIATPSRWNRNNNNNKAPLLSRHQSIQSPRGAARPQAGFFELNHANHPKYSKSFDLPEQQPAPPPPVPPFHPDILLTNGTSSHRQKLLQLQLLHNSNTNAFSTGNEHYIRRQNLNNFNININNADDNSRIYNAESIGGATTSHYGYSSMRCNMKSAASEFSFIRPSSSGYVQSLPNQPTSTSTSTVTAAAAAITTRHQHPPNKHQHLVQNRNSLILGGKTSDHQSTSFKLEQQHQLQKLELKQLAANNDHNNNDVTNAHTSQQQQQQQFLLHPVTAERLTCLDRQQEMFSEPAAAGGDELKAPLRELPLKPNKKRQTTEETSKDSTTQKNRTKKSFLTSAISLIFRKAFWRSSKKQKSSSSKGKRNKLNESFSASIGALACDGPILMPIAPSAFSTGNKSILLENSAKIDNALNKDKEAVQGDRMIDMIEAFTLKHSDGLIGNVNVVSVNNVDERDVRVSSRNRQQHFTQKQVNRVANQFGSPLHKSNSVSTSIGLIQTLEAANAKLNLLYDNSHLTDSMDEPTSGSPLIKRSSKIISANLAPNFNIANLKQHQQNQLMSPRVSARRSEYGGVVLPRPSSIYGQPSMISSSPSSSAMNRDFGTNQHNLFGLHRSSLHNQKNPAQDFMRPLNSRHHHVMSGFQLDTTCEVAEELSSPIVEHDQGKHLLSNAFAFNGREVNNNNNNNNNNVGDGDDVVIDRFKEAAFGKNDNFGNIMSSPSSGRLHQQLYKQRNQAIVKPTIHHLSQSPTVDAIYDNHLISSSSSSNNNNNNNNPQVIFDPSDPLSIANQSFSHYDNHQLTKTTTTSLMIDKLASPSMRLSAQQKQRFGQSATPSTPTARLISTPLRSTGLVNNNRIYSGPNGVVDLMSDKSSAILEPLVQFQSEINHNGISPLVNGHQFDGRLNDHKQGSSPYILRPKFQSNYQESPLIGRDNLRTSIDSQDLEYVVNIAGAPGINLEPSLAASLLRGTNINAYESSTFDRTSGLDRSHQSNQKTFLVSTRLSNSIVDKNNGRKFEQEHETNESIEKLNESDEATCDNDDSSKSGKSG